VGPDHAGDLQLAVDELRNFYGALNGGASPIDSVFAPNMTANIGQVVNVADQTSVAPTFAQIVSGAAAAESPQVLQVCIAWRTALAARRGMGRTFVGPLNTNVNQSDGTVAEAPLARIRNAAAALVTASTASGGWAWGVYGLQSPMPDPPPPNPEDQPRVLRDFTGSAVRDKFAVLRSRRD
jgi:hypothetical protein